jgi:hypothetical protein
MNKLFKRFIYFAFVFIFVFYSVEIVWAGGSGSGSSNSSSSSKSSSSNRSTVSKSSSNSSSSTNRSSNSKTDPNSKKKSSLNTDDNGTDNTQTSNDTDSSTTVLKPTLNVEPEPYNSPTDSLSLTVRVVTNKAVSGKWSYMQGGKQLEKVQSNDSKVTFSIDELDPSRTEVLKFQFEGKVGGKLTILTTVVSIPTVQTSFRKVKDSAMITVKPTGFGTHGKMAIAFYGINNKFKYACEGTTTCVLHDFDEKQSYKVKIYYAGYVSSQEDYDEFEYAFAQTGVFQSGAFSLQKSEKYQVKTQIEEKIDEIKMQLKHKQDETAESVYMFIGGLFLVSAMIVMFMVYRRVK